ncbi:MAG: hypothetical protein GQ576_07005 [Methanococcoides sp.]|nr:hypothetical protein [Methanococcoides sp.]
MAIKAQVERKFKEKYGVPMTRRFNGRLFKISARSRFGLPKSEVQTEFDFLKRSGMKYMRSVKSGKYYYVYSRV